MAIRTFSPFGYEGSLVNVEVDLRKGIPAVDIIGLADGAVKEMRERTRSAILNSGHEYPQERVLISLTPADLKKEGSGFDLPIALAILEQEFEVADHEEVLVMGELELSGSVRAVRGVNAALTTAEAMGIRYAIVPHSENVNIPRGMKVKTVGSLNEAYIALKDLYDRDYSDFAVNTEPEEKFEIKFTDSADANAFDEIKNMNGLKYAMAVAVAGHHNILVSGSHGCGKTMMLQHFPDLMPDLLPEEKPSVRRIYSISGLESSKEIIQRPFRMPHQTASLEGMVGGGENLRPGEINLAHNGVLFLDEAAEFKGANLQMLRVPLETKQITLCRAGRSTIYPANFQLVMATAPCPCGNFGNKDKVCLCSAKAVEQYWKKFSSPLLDRVAIRFDCNNPFNPDPDHEWTLEELRNVIRIAWETQYKRQGKLNNDLTSKEVDDIIVPSLHTKAKELLDKQTEINGWSPRTVSNIMKLARTYADIEFSENIVPRHIESAIGLNGKTPLETMFN